MIPGVHKEGAFREGAFREGAFREGAFREGALPVLLHLLLAIALTWPSVLDPVGHLPGSVRTDVWDSLWSFWYFSERLLAGMFPLSVDGLLNHPEGGVLWVADPLNALLLVPLIPLVGLPTAYTLLVVGHTAFSGIAAHFLGRAVWGRAEAGWFAGIAWQAAPLMLAHIHNGASEAIAGGWLAWAALCLWRLREASTVRNVLLAAFSLGLTTLAHWYSGVAVFLLAGVMGLSLLYSPGENPTVRKRISRIVPFFAAGALSLILILPVAWLSHDAATAKENVVGIKSEKELTAVRRTIGPADLRNFFYGGDFRSPDFQELSPYAEEHVHCAYLGYVLILGAILAGRRQKLWWVAAFLALLLSLGPVVVKDGAPLLVRRTLALPLPYLLLEKLPGFSSLSLLYRLSQLSVLSLAVLAGGGWSRWGSRGGRLLLGAACLATLLETRFFSPMHGGLRTIDAGMDPAFATLREAPEGAVMSYPIAGGRPYLYEQTFHRKPLASTLNFPNNKASMTVWRTILEHTKDPPGALPAAVEAVAKPLGVRYIVVHLDPMARPDMHDIAVAALKSNLSPIADSGAVRIYQLW